ncbi:MAG: endonuclease V [Anaeromicrobium sp.]|jgi:deoxyribonuclease V|uniref:endonuclease V n=1 Tax=Anaeromicrobium sp. TaxID=1929132 RepID=UPI0025FBA740|nr:endonuclease V [Anaeromicrobium sp.]MCT4595087.1 endonuclease V [Anaeromicrobium sp.]
MEITNVHDFKHNNEEEFIKIQEKLKERIELTNKINFNNIKTYAGVDLAYWEEKGEPFGVCSIIVIDANTKEVIEKVYSFGKIEVPYVAGFLAFRELPLIIEAAKKLTIEPDVFLFDGNGYLHYNHMGVATHASFFLNKPTIGIGKSYLKIKKVEFEMPENEEGAFTHIVIDEVIYGRAVRTLKNVKPIFLSCGNYIDLETSYKILMSLVNKDSKLPIPVRLADLETHILRKRLRSE